MIINSRAAVMRRRSLKRNIKFSPYFEALRTNQKAYIQAYNTILQSLLQFNTLDWLDPVQPKDIKPKPKLKKKNFN